VTDILDTLKPAAEAAGMELGTRRVAYTDRDAILYALAVGAAAEDLDLVFERDLRVLPTFGLGLGLWACDELGDRGYFSSTNSLHAGQRLEVLGELPKSGELELAARVVDVWDKGAPPSSTSRCPASTSAPSTRSSPPARAAGAASAGRAPAATRSPRRPGASACRRAARVPSSTACSVTVT
jgi:hypothetical protein